MVYATIVLEVQMLEVGHWYNSKNGYLCRAEMLHQDGSITVTSHYTGNKIKVDVDQAKHLKETDEPSVPPGTALKIIKDEDKKIDKSFHLYQKYPHIVPDSIYKVRTTNKPVKEIAFKEEGKIRIKSVKHSSGNVTRCVIQCQTKKCKNTRDIKVQDAWAVTTCEECTKRRRKEKLKEFLAQRKKKCTKSGTKNTHT